LNFAVKGCSSNGQPQPALFSGGEHEVPSSLASKSTKYRESLKYHSRRRFYQRRRDYLESLEHTTHRREDSPHGHDTNVSKLLFSCVANPLLSTAAILVEARRHSSSSIPPALNSPKGDSQETSRYATECCPPGNQLPPHQNLYIYGDMPGSLLNTETLNSGTLLDEKGLASKAQEHTLGS